MVLLQFLRAICTASALLLEKIVKLLFGEFSCGQFFPCSTVSMVYPDPFRIFFFPPYSPLIRFSFYVWIFCVNFSLPFSAPISYFLRCFFKIIDGFFGKARFAGRGKFKLSIVSMREAGERQQFPAFGAFLGNIFGSHVCLLVGDVVRGRALIRPFPVILQAA